MTKIEIIIKTYYISNGLDDEAGLNVQIFQVFPFYGNIL